MTKRNLFIFFAFILGNLATLFASVTVCSSDSGADVLQTIVAVIPSDFPPTYFRDPKDGKPSGLAVDVMNELAHFCGLKIEYRFAKPWDEIESIVLAGQADIIPFRALNEKTKQRFLFTNTLDTSPVNYIARASESFARGTIPGKKVGVIRGSTADIRLQDQQEMTVVPYESMQHLLMDLLTGQIDRVLTVTDNLLDLANDAGLRERVQAINPPAFEITRVIALQSGNTSLQGKFNEAIRSFDGSAKQKEIYKKWLGKPKPWWTVKRVLFTSSGSFIAVLLLLFAWRFVGMQRLNKRLRAEQSFLQTMIDAIPEPIFYKNCEGVFTGCNAFFAESVLGLKKEQIIGLTDFDLCSDQKQAAFFREQDKRAIASGKPNKNDEWIFLADGRSILVETMKIPFQNESGEIVGLIGVAREMTERYQALKIQAEARQKLQTFLDNMPMMAWLKDREGRFEMVNEAFIQSCGRDIKEVIGKTDLDVWPLKLADKYRSDDEQVMSSRLKGEFEEPIEIAKVSRWCMTFRTPITDQNGAVIGTVGIAQDITERKQAEDVLRRFQLLVTQSRDIIFFIRREDLRILEANEAATKAYGYSREQLLTMTIQQLREPETLDLLPGQLEQADMHGILLETVHRRCDGSSFPVEVSSRGEDIGGVRTLISIVRDITERKNAEETVRISEERFRKIFNESPVGIAFLGKQREIFLTNQRYRDFLGYSEKEILEIKPEKLLHPDDWAPSVELSTRLRSGEIPAFHMEQRYIRKDGVVVWADTRITVLRDKEGRLIHTIGWVLDITSRKQGEEALRKREEEYKRLSNEFNAVLEAIPDSLALVSSDLKVLWANRNAVESMQVEKEAYLPGEPCYKLWHNFEEPCETCSLKKVFATGEICEFVMTEEGKTREFRLIPVKDDAGKVFNTVRLGRDISEMRNLEAQLHQAQKMEAIGTLAGGIAHDFNNILGAILGYAEMAYEDSLSGSVKPSDLNQVVQASHRAKDLVKQILAFSRQTEAQKILIRPAAMVKESIKLLRSSIPTTIDIQQDIDSEADLILADPTQIHQIMMNLCTNAYHAMEETGGTLSVSLQNKVFTQHDLAGIPDVQPGRFVQLSVRDTGPGIAPVIQERIFDPYFTTKETGKGTGMGLAIVHGIVKSSGGFITFHSEIGAGTVFEICLPAFLEQITPETKEDNLIPVGTERILFVDDEEMLAKMGRTMLERLGYMVTIKMSSLEALTTFKNNPDAFDLVITDQTMPGMTGVDLAQKLLQIRPGLPIILCTGYSSQVSEETVKSYGITGFALKPLAKKDIAVLIRKLLDEERKGAS